MGKKRKKSSLGLMYILEFLKNNRVRGVGRKILRCRKKLPLNISNLLFCFHILSFSSRRSFRKVEYEI